MNNHLFVLASASPARLNLIKQLGITVSSTISTDINEDVKPNEPVKSYVQRVATEKNQVAHHKTENSWVLSADTVIYCQRQILSKTDEIDIARGYLERLSGKRHRAITSFVISNPQGHQRVKLVETIVKFKTLHKSEIDQYLSSDEWVNKAGAYSIQGKAAQFISFLRGSYTNVVGLPLYEVSQMLKGMGYNEF